MISYVINNHGFFSCLTVEAWRDIAICTGVCVFVSGSVHTVHSPIAEQSSYCELVSCIPDQDTSRSQQKCNILLHIESFTSFVSKLTYES